MKVKSEQEIQKAAAMKAFVSAVRLKYTLAADREISERAPAFEAEIELAIARGEVLELDPADFVRNA